MQTSLVNCFTGGQFHANVSPESVFKSYFNSDMSYIL